MVVLLVPLCDAIHLRGDPTAFQPCYVSYLGNSRLALLTSTMMRVGAARTKIFLGTGYVHILLSHLSEAIAGLDSRFRS